MNIYFIDKKTIDPFRLLLLYYCFIVLLFYYKHLLISFNISFLLSTLFK
jgi:hypothetical protein